MTPERNGSEHMPQLPVRLTDGQEEGSRGETLNQTKLT